MLRRVGLLKGLTLKYCKSYKRAEENRAEQDLKRALDFSKNQKVSRFRLKKQNSFKESYTHILRKLLKTRQWENLKKKSLKKYINFRWATINWNSECQLSWVPPPPPASRIWDGSWFGGWSQKAGARSGENEIGEENRTMWGPITEGATGSDRGSDWLGPPELSKQRTGSWHSPISGGLPGKLTCTSGLCLSEGQAGPRESAGALGRRWKVS